MVLLDDLNEGIEGKYYIDPKRGFYLVKGFYSITPEDVVLDTVDLSIEAKELKNRRRSLVNCLNHERAPNFFVDLVQARSSPKLTGLGLGSFLRRDELDPSIPECELDAAYHTFDREHFLPK